MLFHIRTRPPFCPLSRLRRIGTNHDRLLRPIIMTRWLLEPSGHSRKNHNQNENARSDLHAVLL
jgi:hypothetical protein